MSKRRMIKVAGSKRAREHHRLAPDNTTPDAVEAATSAAMEAIESSTLFKEAEGRASSKKIRIKLEKTNEDTPWGISLAKYPYADGVVKYSTEEHHGFKLSDIANSKVPEPFRKKDGWYEGDLEGFIVIRSHPEAFEKDVVAESADVLKDFYPHEWMATTGEILELKDSEVLREEHNLVN